MPVHKINPQDESTFIAGTVVDAELAPSKNPKYKPQYKISVEVGGETVDLYESQIGVDRQLKRLGLGAVEELVGGDFAFSKTPMAEDPSRGFINITRVAGTPRPAAKRPAATAKAAHSAGPLVPGLDALDDFDIIEEDAAVTADLQRALRPSASKVVRAPEPVAPAPVGGETLEHFIERYTAFAQAFVNGPGVIYAEAQVPYDGATIQSAFASFDIGNQRGGKR